MQEIGGGPTISQFEDYVSLEILDEPQTPSPVRSLRSRRLEPATRYRLTYRYRCWHETNANAYIGLTAKIRDAEISLEGNGIKAQKTNVGFVPLLYLRADWTFAHPWGLLLDAEALAAPQGRAEDVLLAVTYQADEHWRSKLGYRFVEGGGDNKEVYSFAAIHYAVVGVTATY